MAHQPYQQPMGDAFSINDTDARNRGAKAANVAAHAASQHQKAGAKSQKVDQEDLAKLVAEEGEQGKAAKIPGSGTMATYREDGRRRLQQCLSSTRFTGPGWRGCHQSCSQI